MFLGSISVRNTESGVIADYSLIYDAQVFASDSVEDALDSVKVAIDSGLEQLKTVPVGNYTVDEDYIEDTAKGELEEESKQLIINNPLCQLAHDV